MASAPAPQPKDIKVVVLESPPLNLQMARQLARSKDGWVWLVIFMICLSTKLIPGFQ